MSLLRREGVDRCRDAANMIVPPWVYLAGGALALGISFGAGWKVRAWKCDAALVAAVKVGVKETKEQQDAVHAVAAQHAQETDDAAQATQVRQLEIRTIYKDRVVAADCEPPADALGVLDRGIEAATARAGGKPGPIMPSRTTTPDPVH